MSKGKDLIIRNSTAEFLIFEKQAHADSIEVRYEDETLWLTQKMMSNLFDVTTKTISEHLTNIYESGELDKDPTIRKFRIRCFSQRRKPSSCAYHRVLNESQRRLYHEGWN